MRELTLEEVQTILTEGVALARSKGFPSTVAVVDMGGNVRGVLRPEKGRIANPDIAIKKAWTAAALHRSTTQVRDIMITTDKFGHGLQFTDERFCIVGGGFPIRDEAGDVIGGVADPLGGAPMTAKGAKGAKAAPAKAAPAKAAKGKPAKAPVKAKKK